MPYFAYVENNKVIYVKYFSTLNLIGKKWTLLNKSGVTLKESTYHDVTNGDLVIENKYYKKNAETGETILVEDGMGNHPKAEKEIIFSGIVNGEIVGQFGILRKNFQNQEEENNFVNSIINSNVIELTNENKFLVNEGWLYDGVNFIEPENMG